MIDRLLLITHNYPKCPGDYTGVFIKTLVDALGDTVKTVKVLLPRKKYHESNEIPVDYIGKFKFYNGLAQYQKNFGAWVALASFIWNGYRRARALMGAEKWVVNAHWWFPGGVIAWLLYKIHNTPYYITAHGTEISVAAQKWYLRPLAKQVLSSAKAIIPVSRHLALKIRPLAPRSPIKIQGMPFDNDLFYPNPDYYEKIKWYSPGFRAVYAGNLIERKGLEYLIDAIGPCEDWTLRICGDGPLMGALMDKYLIKYNNIVFMGRVSRAEFAYILRRSHALVLPSVTRGTATEGLGMVLIEAMACGIPVVTTGNGGAGEVVCDLRNGLVVEEGSASSIQWALSSIYGSGGWELISKLRSQGFMTAQHYTKPFVAKRYLDILSCS